MDVVEILLVLDCRCWILFLKMPQADPAILLEKVPQDLFHSVYFEYEENCTHDRLLSLNYTFCHIKRLRMFAANEKVFKLFF